MARTTIQTGCREKKRDGCPQTVMLQLPTASGAPTEHSPPQESQVQTYKPARDLQTVAARGGSVTANSSFILKPILSDPDFKKSWVRHCKQLQKSEKCSIYIDLLVTLLVTILCSVIVEQKKA